MNLSLKLAFTIKLFDRYHDTLCYIKDMHPLNKCLNKLVN